MCKDNVITCYVEAVNRVVNALRKLQENCVKLYMSRSFVHHSLGACERTYSTLAEKLKPYISKIFLPAVVFAMNSSANSEFSTYGIIYFLSLIPSGIFRRCIKVYTPTWKHPLKNSVIRKIRKEIAESNADKMVAPVNKNPKELDFQKKKLCITKHQETDKNYRIGSVVNILSNNCQVRAWWYCATQRQTTG